MVSEVSLQITLNTISYSCESAFNRRRKTFYFKLHWRIFL